MAPITLARQSMVKSVAAAVREHVISLVELSVETIAFIALVLLTPEAIFKRSISRQVDRATLLLESPHRQEAISINPLVCLLKRICIGFLLAESAQVQVLTLLMFLSSP